MKQTFLRFKWPTLILAAAISFSSCKKDSNNASVNDPDPIATVDAAQSESDASGQYEEVFDISMGVQADDAGEDIGLGTGGGILYKPASPDGALGPDSSRRCFTITVDHREQHYFPKIVTIDFGSGCTGKDGKVRSGKIVTVFTGPMFIPGSKATTHFVDYNVDSFKVTGTLAVENTSSSNRKAWTLTVNDGQITNTNNGNWRKWQGVKERTQIEGNGTPLYLLDDVFAITGHGYGSNSRGTTWKAEVVEPIIKKFICAWRSKGTVRIIRNDVHAILDYGDGSCDNKASITINGVSHIITLH